MQCNPIQSKVKRSASRICFMYDGHRNELYHACDILTNVGEADSHVKWPWKTEDGLLMKCRSRLCLFELPFLCLNPGISASQKKARGAQTIFFFVSPLCRHLFLVFFGLHVGCAHESLQIKVNGCPLLTFPSFFLHSFSSFPFLIVYIHAPLCRIRFCRTLPLKPSRTAWP